MAQTRDDAGALALIRDIDSELRDALERQLLRLDADSLRLHE